MSSPTLQSNTGQPLRFPRHLPICRM